MPRTKRTIEGDGCIVANDGRVFVASGGFMHVLDGDTRSLVETSGPGRFSVTPDGRIVVIAHVDYSGTVEAFETATGKRILLVKGQHAAACVALAESNAYGSPGVIRLFDTKKWKLLSTLEVGTSGSDGNSYAAHAIAFAPDGKTFCAAAHSGRGLVFELRSKPR